MTPSLLRSTKDNAGGIRLYFTKDIPETRHIFESFVRVPPAVAIAPLQRPAANAETVHELRKHMLGVQAPILKVRSPL